jgi:hypothetical protein
MSEHDDAVADAAAALEGLDLERLREAWRARYGAPPTLRSPEILAMMLAWRIQAERHGGLDADVRRALRRPAPARGSTAPAPAGGAKLVREWQGTEHEVIVAVEGGFIYRGRRFRSLSHIARQITGTRWNGPRFFGLRPEQSAL